MPHGLPRLRYDVDVTIVAGIDEAGYGPLLGPLVVACAAFEVDDEVADTDLWSLLAPTVVRRPPKRNEPRIAVDDSKRLYSGGRGLWRLERGVLGMLSATGHRPRTLTDLLEITSPGAVKCATSVPWYRDVTHALPAAADGPEIEAAIEALDRQLVRTTIRPRRIAAELLFEPELNRLIADGATKADAAFGRVAALLQELRHDIPAGHVILHLDRQGGRTHYLEPLSRALPNAVVGVVEEGRQASRYLVEDGDRTWEIRVAVGGDRLQLPVALASMTAKYVRELMMGLFNRFWAARVPGLRPTAGYPADGHRFLTDIAPMIGALAVDPATLVRCR
jgi:hypothetical protein